jgi:hypothetical protein
MQAGHDWLRYDAGKWLASKAHRQVKWFTNRSRCIEVLKTSETYYVENIKSTNLRIHEIVNFNQITKIHIHEEKYFHSNLNSFNTLDKWAVDLCNRKWNLHINVFIFSIIFFTYINLESEQNLLLNFIIIDKCKSVIHEEKYFHSNLNCLCDLLVNHLTCLCALLANHLPASYLNQSWPACISLSN